MGYVPLVCTYDMHLHLLLDSDGGFSEYEYVAMQMRSGSQLRRNRNQPAKPYVNSSVSCLQSEFCTGPFQGMRSFKVRLV